MDTRVDLNIENVVGQTARDIASGTRALEKEFIRYDIRCTEGEEKISN